jgi:tetratricopeptide (TPR) repeat protein
MATRPTHHISELASQRLAVNQKRQPAPGSVAKADKQAKTSLEQNLSSKWARISTASSRKVSAEKYPFFPGLAKEDSAFREIDHEQKKKWYEEAISYFLKVGKEDPHYQEALFRYGYCTYRCAMIETDIQKKLDLAQKALGILSTIGPTHPDFKNKQFLQGACNYELGTYAFDWKKRELLEEAAAFFAKVDSDDPNPKHIAFRQGEWKYNLSFSAAAASDKRKLLEEAFACFSKNDPADLTFKEISLRQGDCKFQLAIGVSASLGERQYLLQEAFEFYSVVGREDPRFSDVVWKQGECKFEQAFCELDLQKKRLLYEEALGLYKKAGADHYPDFHKGALRKGQCQYQVALYISSPREKVALLNEALDCFLTIHSQHPLFKDVPLHIGDCKFLLALCVPKSSEEKPKFLQQASRCYADCNPQTREIRWQQGECKFHQAQCNPYSPANRQLYEEAISFFADLSPDHPKFKELLYYKAHSKFMCALFESDIVVKQGLAGEALNCYVQIVPSDGPFFEPAQSMIKECYVLLDVHPAEGEYLF